MTEQSVLSEHKIVIERIFDAPRGVMWKVWTDPDEVSRWWGPAQFTTPREKIEYDLRPGGVRRMTMVGPDGAEYPSDGRYSLVEPPERLSFSEDIIDSPLIEHAETTVEFIALDESRTKVLITSRLICAPELVAMAQAGWTTQLEKLERLLAG